MKTNRTLVCLSFFIIVFSFFANSSFGQLKARFTSNIQSGCSPLIVAFEDQSTGNPSSWKWNLGNGVTSLQQEPITTYFNPGVYTVKLTVKNSSGADSVTETEYITVYANPQVAFSASPVQGCFPLKVDFGNGSKAGSGTITDYLWDFGDGNISTDVKSDHIYTSSGTFDITLKITNSYGCTSALTKSDLVHIEDGVNADFSLNSLNVCKKPATAVFKNKSEGSGTINYTWNFGDGSTVTSKDATHNYTASGTYNVILTAESAGGCSDTATMHVTVAIPSSSFNNTSATCSNQSIAFTNTSLPTPLSSKWYFGDGTSSTDLNPDKTYTKTGTYTVKLVNVFSANCSDSVTKTITIASGPLPSFKADDTARCAAPFNVNFFNTSTGNAIQYIWDFGDGDTSHGVNPAHVYTKSGSFDVTLTAINGNGCQTVFEKKDYINIQPVRITRLTNLPDSGCIPFPVSPTIVLNTTTPVKSYSWDFGDGGTSSAANPVHTYTKEGIYAIKVSIETEDGCTANYTMKNAVFAGHKPHADFVGQFDTTCANAGVLFTNTSTNGPITFLQWNGTEIRDSASGQVYFFNPVDTGYRSLKLVAFNYGCSDTIIKKNAIYALPPMAYIQTKLNCSNKNLVNFIDASIVDVEHTWDFGDSTTGTEKNPAHLYTSPGTYNIRLYTKNKTCADTATATIHVINEQGTMSLASNIYCRGNTMTADITGINLDNIKNTKWNFGDGTIITINGGTKATHSYVLNGKFEITAVMTDLNNCQYFYTSPDSITVYGPLANFSSPQSVICQDNTVIFKDRSQSDGIHDIVTWTWDYGDYINREYYSTQVFSHTYPDTGYFSPRLIVTDSYGCSDSTRRGNYVYVSHPFASFTISDSIICPGSRAYFQSTSTGNNLQYIWKFGDGEQSTLESPGHNYKKSGTFVPSLIVSDINGCLDSIASQALIVASPVAKFSMSDSFSTCPPLQVNFTNKSGSYKSFSWDFGDGSTSVIPAPDHIYTYPGIYPVKLTLKGYGECADTLVKNVVIKGPTGKLIYDSKPLCSPASVNFSATASHTQSYTWDFSDGNVDITQKNQTQHTYDTGFFVPKLILMDSLGCKVSIVGSDTVKIFNVIANAVVSGNEACDSALTKFTDISQSKDLITHHIWYFGDKDTADAPQINHSYNKTGTYNATLIAITKYGCRDTLNIGSPVVVNPSPDIQIIGDSIACAFAPVNFKAKNAEADASNLQWNWEFDNDSSASGQSAGTSYSKGGNYTVSLIATSTGGCSDTTSHKIKINSPPPVNAGTDTSICQNSMYQLSASGALNYTWQGIGLSCTNCQSPNVTVDSFATYVVTGKDAIGCAATDSVSLKVIAPTAITVTGNDTLCIGEKTQFSASGAATYQWYPAQYLDNAKSPNPVFTATTDTAVTYRVVGFAEHNCFSDTGFVSVKTFPVPQMNFQANEITLSVGSSVRLLSNSTADITQWQWTPSTGLDNAASANPVASPKQTVTYTCIASNGGGCIARDEVTVRVICKNTNVFIPNTFSPNGDGMNDLFYPRGTGLFTVKTFRIFNRWGQLVFERYNVLPNNAAHGWNGTYNSKQMQSDVYVYMMEILCENGSIIPVKGNVTLLR
jgi:gliding motility-associated-like protein